MDMLWGYGLLYNMSNGHYLSIYLFFVINLRKGSFYIFLSWHWKIAISLLSIRVLWYYNFDQFTILFDLVSWANSDHQSLFSVYVLFLKLLWYLAWPFTILQNDNITISWDFFQADSTSSHAGTPWCCQPEIISWYHNIIIL